MDLAELIVTHKRGRSYRQLAKDGGDMLTAGRVQQLATAPLKSWPEAGSVAALARMLYVSELAVVLAAAESLGIDVTQAGGLASYLPSGTEALRDDQKAALAALVRSMLPVESTTEDETNAESAAREKSPDDEGSGAPDMLDVRDEAIRLATQGEGLSARQPTSITSLSPKHQQMVKDSMPVEEAAYTGHVRRGSDEWIRIKEAREAEKRVGEESQDDGGFDPA